MMVLLMGRRRGLVLLGLLLADVVVIRRHFSRAGARCPSNDRQKK